MGLRFWRGREVAMGGELPGVFGHTFGKCSSEGSLASWLSRKTF